MIGNNKTNIPYKLLLTDRQVSILHKAFANNSLINVKLSKTRLSKIIQSGGFLDGFPWPLLKVVLPLMKNILKPVAKVVLIPLGLTAAASAANEGVRKKSPRVWTDNLNTMKRKHERHY